jgi:probable rRNA maturation factor
VDPDSKRLRVTVSDGRGRPVRDGGLARWLESVAPPRARGELAVALASDARVRALNRAYRGQDGLTDVLSFPADPDAAPNGRGRGPLLGDIVIATGVARRQAQAAGHAERVEWRVLALHGLLHLLGHDHHGEADARRMAQAERRLRLKGGLKLGLIERAAERVRR